MRRGVQILEIAYNLLKTKTLSISEPVVPGKRICRIVDSGIVSSIFCHCKRFTFDKTNRQPKISRLASLDFAPSDGNHFICAPLTAGSGQIYVFYIRIERWIENRYLNVAIAAGWAPETRLYFRCILQKVTVPGALNVSSH